MKSYQTKGVESMINKRLVKLAREYATTYENRRLEILNMKTVQKSLDHFNWLVDMFCGNTYELEEDSRYHAEWIKAKQTFDSLKVKARNIVCNKFVEVVILRKYDDERSEVAIGRNRFIVMNRDLKEIK